MCRKEKEMISPCISVCKFEPISGYCYGCGRTAEEKAIWKDESTVEEWKAMNLLEIQTRLAGWQKFAFQVSYKEKAETGMSLIKRKLMEKKNANK